MSPTDGNCHTGFVHRALPPRQHEPRLVTWFAPGAPIPGSRAGAGDARPPERTPLRRPPGERLREWMAVDEATFYDRDCMAIAPMARLFPGYDGKGRRPPPPALCARTGWGWRGTGAAMLILIGGHAQRFGIGAASRGGVTATVCRLGQCAADLSLPHPFRRNAPAGCGAILVRGRTSARTRAPPFAG